MASPSPVPISLFSPTFSSAPISHNVAPSNSNSAPSTSSNSAPSTSSSTPILLDLAPSTSNSLPVPSGPRIGHSSPVSNKLPSSVSDIISSHFNKLSLVDRATHHLTFLNDCLEKQYTPQGLRISFQVNVIYLSL